MKGGTIAEARPVESRARGHATVVAGLLAASVVSVMAATSPGPLLGVPGSSASPPSLQEGSFACQADFYTDEASPLTRYGTAPLLRVDGTPLVLTYLRCSIPINADLQGAALMLHAARGRSPGILAYVFPDARFYEVGPSDLPIPSDGDTPIGISSEVVPDEWVSIDVGSAVKSGDSYAFMLASPSGEAISFSSREAGEATAPYLRTTWAANSSPR